MDGSVPDVLLLRAPDDPDPYVRAFQSAGLQAECHPVLEFRFPHGDALRERLRQREQYGGIIATSSRAGRALQQVLEENEALHDAWSGAPVYVVGPKTAAQFRALGFEVLGEDSGNAGALASWIAEADPEQPLLFLSGNRRRDTLPAGLRDAGITFEEQVVYETHTRSDLSLPTSAKSAWLVFFSPSGLEAIRKSEIPLTSYRCAAIGPTTAAALEEEGLSVQAVAESPSPEGIVDAIQANA